MSTCKKLLTPLIALIIILPLLSNAEKQKSGKGFKEIYTIQLSDLNGHDAWLPYIGEYPVLIVYEDFSNVGENKKLYLRIMEQEEIRSKVKLVYISNTAPAWLTPDILIRMFFREREHLAKGVTFLIDHNRSLQKKWRLLDADDKSVIILVNRKGEIIDIKYDTPDRKGLDKVIDMMKEMIDF